MFCNISDRKVIYVHNFKPWLSWHLPDPEFKVAWLSQYVNHIPFNIILGVVPRDEVPLHYLQPDTVYLMIESKEADESSPAELPLTNLLQYLATHVTVLVSETCITHLNSLK